MRWFAVLVVVLLALGSAAGVGVGQPADGRAPAHGASLGPIAQTETPNGTGANASTGEATTMRISLQENGDARWDVTARFALRDENETAAFRQLASEYESGETDVGPTRDAFERVAERSSADRPMAIRDVNRSAKVLENGTLGTLTISFAWTNFTQVESDRIVLDDVFDTDSGTWLPELSGDQKLIIEGPGGYVVQDTPKGVQNFNEIHYEGPQSFEQGEIEAVYAPRSNPTGPGDGSFLNISGVPGLIIALFIVSAGGAGAYALTQRRDDPDVTEAADTTPSAPPAQPIDQREGADAADATVDDADAKLLSDEERILRLLRKSDGRMKQADIVKETNWSNAKVSQLLSKMDDSDDVDKLRIGRENLITLPDEDVTDVN